MHMQPMHVYAEKEGSFINVGIVVHTCIHEWIYNFGAIKPDPFRDRMNCEYIIIDI